MILSIAQPAYLPWPGYFDRIMASDVHVVLDHVQLDKNSTTKFTNRNKIKTPQGETWLTIPILTKGHQNELSINKLEVVCDGWQEKHLRTIQNFYSKAACFGQFQEHLARYYQQRLFTKLIEPLREGLALFCRLLNISTPLHYSSEMNCVCKKSDLILEICQKLGATTYISGPFGRDYLEREKFEAAGIKILFHEYEYIPYPQRFGSFLPGLSTIDMLLNIGEEAITHIPKGRKLLPC